MPELLTCYDKCDTYIFWGSRSFVSKLAGNNVRGLHFAALINVQQRQYRKCNLANFITEQRTFSCNLISQLLSLSTFSPVSIVIVVTYLEEDHHADNKCLPKLELKTFTPVFNYVLHTLIIGFSILV